MANVARASDEALDLSGHLRIHDRCKAFEAAWAAVGRPGATPPEIASFVPAVTGAERDALLKELLLLDLEFRAQSQAELAREVYLAKLPGCEPVIDEALAEHGRREAVEDTAAVNGTADDRSQQARSPADGATPPGEPPAAEDRQRDVPAHVAEPGATRTAPPPPVPADAVQVGKYVLLERLGVGGMGAVYKAWHPLLKRYVAIKLIRPELTSNPVAVQRFLGEIEAAGRIDHPHIVRAYDAGVEHGRYHLVLELVEGRPVSQLLAVLGQWPIPEACEVVRQAALGLQKVHECGLVHRDVKPSNLMLTPNGTVKILDLGLSRLQPDWPATPETRPGDVVGTADYMAPEQAGDSHTVDIRADIYSLGCTLYHLLAGRPPFGDSRQKGFFSKLAAHCQERVPAIGQFRNGVSAEFVTVLDRMLAKASADRFGTPAELARALQPLARGSDLVCLCHTAQRAGSELNQPPGTDQPNVVVSAEPDRLVSPNAQGFPIGARPRKRAYSWGLAGVTTAILLAALAGVIYVATDRGTLQIQTYDLGVQVAVVQNGHEVTVADLSTGSEVKLRTGTYELEVRGAGADVQVTPNQIVVRRGQTAIARIILRRACADQLAAPLLPGQKHQPSWDAATSEPRDRPSASPSSEHGPPSGVSQGTVDREVAEITIRFGGYVDLIDAGTIKRLEDLPGGRIRLVKVDTSSARGLPPDFPAKVAELQDLQAAILVNAPLTDHGLQTLTSRTRLRWLYIGGTKVTDDGVGIINAFSNLETLSLYGLPVTDAGVGSLRTMTGLAKLNLGNTQITDKSLLALAKFRKLQGLFLTATRITDEGIAHLKQLQELERLALDATKISDASIPVLASLRSLKELDVRNTCITQKGITELQLKLPLCRIDY